MLIKKEQPKMARKNKKKESWPSFFGFLLLVLIIRSLLFSPFRIPSGSMIPTLKVGDFIVTSKFHYGWSRYSLFMGGFFNYFSGRIMGNKTPDRGDIVVFAAPSSPETDYIKRVIGLPGDTVQMIGGHLYLNGSKVPLVRTGKESDWDGKGTNQKTGVVYSARLPRKDGSHRSYSIQRKEDFGTADLDDTPLTTVPEDHFFVMGDNWNRSADSRGLLGNVPKSHLLGPALFTFFSIDHEKIKLFKPWTWLLIPFKIRINRSFYMPLS
jgi:signal peptidase I